MKFRSVRYYITEALRNLVKNRLMTVAAVVTLASCIFMVIVTYCLAVNVDFILKQLEESVIITVYILEEADADDVNTMYDKIYSMEHVKAIEYISKDEALNKAKEWWEDSEEILGGFEGPENPFPRAFDIEVDDIRYQSSIIDALEDMSHMGIEKVRHSQKITDVLITINNVMRVVSIIIILGLSVISVVIIMNTIKLAVNARKIEINIMKYVGATDWFIRWPFIVEGLLIGILGAILPVAICWTAYSNAIEAISNIQMIQELFEFRTAMSVFPILTPIVIIIGMLIGISGSVTSIRRHLKV